MGFSTAIHPLGGEKEPYKSGTVIATLTNNQTFSGTLPPGVYEIFITGGGGNGSGWAAGGYPWCNSGGSGATFEGEFRNTSKKTMKLYAGGNVLDSYLDLNGVRMITAGKGTSSIANSTAGAGGVISLNSALKIVKTYKIVNGNPGLGTALAWDRAGGVTTSTYNWGEGSWVKTVNAVQAGGLKLVYLRK